MDATPEPDEVALPPAPRLPAHPLPLEDRRHPNPFELQRMIADNTAQITNDAIHAMVSTNNNGAPNPPAPLRFAAPMPLTGFAVAAPALPPQPWISRDAWQCHKCQKENLASKTRCGSCQAWKGGRREGYGKRKAGMMAHYDLAQESWKCPCGNENKAKKVRCTKCQKWRGGRRMRKGADASEWRAHQLAAAAASSSHPSSRQTPQSPWTCDKCGHANECSKVRCASCPRWRDGRRPKYGKKAKARIEEAMRLNAGSTAGCFVGIAGRPGEPTAVAAQGVNWFCSGCNHLNRAKKSRCGSCQRWKFGKRENMLKKNRPAFKENARQGSAVVQTTTDAVGYQLLAGSMAAGTAAVAVASPNKQQQKHLVVKFEQNDALAPSQLQSDQTWSCSCGQTNNLASKSRCSTCQRWKGGKRENMKRKSPKQEQCAHAVIPNVGLRATPNQPNTPWKCTRCGDDNGCKKLRCRTCQSWKNARKQVIQQAELGTMTNSKPAANGLAATRQQPDGTLYAPPWECHGCKARVLGTKNRCPSCKSWRGGVRLNFGKNKIVSKPWACNRCEKQNDGNRVRCAVCQSWRGGGRPDVAARRAEEKELNGNGWTCDRCQRSNKPSKVRCGGCQRWRGGQRPDMRKSAQSFLVHQQPLGANHHLLHTPPNQMMHLRMHMQASGPPVQPPSNMPGQTTNTPNDATHVLLPVQNNQDSAPCPRQVVAPMAQDPAVATTADVVARPHIGAWTCTKCTCDNLATEIVCKICESVRDGWLG